ncbi:DUF6368 family protein [Kitasatospora sp. NPDC089913]|uniref:DUF6368 family protein n=1 Tax=Kitasatospora sp. NPDC089913 TaxID=3364080 RepID=UPI00380A4FFE
MSGPVLVIELAEAVPAATVERLRDVLVGSSAWFVEKRPGGYDLNVVADRIGVTDLGEVDGRRPFLVHIMGPGIGDEEIFEAEHADGPNLEPLIGFSPTHAVDVIAGCNRPIDHITTALLTAAIMDVVGGVASAELLDDQVDVVAGLPGVLAMTGSPWPTVFGTAEFLRAWAVQPRFRLLK